MANDYVMTDPTYGLADVTNGTDGTYYYRFNPLGTKINSLMGILSGGSGTCTVTLEATMDNSMTSTTFQDITVATYGVVSWTSTFTAVDSAEKLKGYAWCRVKVVAATGAANDADWKIMLIQRDEK